MQEMINVVKIGGNIINDPEKLKSFLKSFSEIEGKKILVHGGGKEATELSRKLGIETKMIDGRRITDRETLDIVTMTYAGLINKRIVALLQSYGCDAIGMTGADGNSIPATRRSPEPIDYGFVGDIDPRKINAEFIDSLIREDTSPVFCAICHDGKGTLLNCNADSVASAIAIAMASKDDVRLTYCFEMPGVMEDIENPESVIPLITSEEFDALVEKGTISGGMIPKVSNALNATKAGVKEVRICDFTSFGDDGGTLIKQ